MQQANQITPLNGLVWWDLQLKAKTLCEGKETGILFSNIGK